MGVQNATSMSITDKLTREHKMTVDEARLILNVGKENGMEAMMKVTTVINNNCNRN
jgi:mitochondrial import inner membrane translocase subunit TIM16